jgi:hypothetical protein
MLCWLGICSAAEGTTHLNDSTLVFFYDALGPKTLVMLGLVAVAAIGIVVAVALMVIRAIRNRKGTNSASAGSTMNQERNPYQAPLSTGSGSSSAVKSSERTKRLSILAMLIGAPIGIIAYAIALNFDLDAPELHGAHWVAKICIFVGVLLTTLGALYYVREKLRA